MKNAQVRTCALARKQKYIYIYISLHMKTFLKTAVYIYIYIYIFFFFFLSQILVDAAAGYGLPPSQSFFSFYSGHADVCSAIIIHLYRAFSTRFKGAVYKNRQN